MSYAEGTSVSVERSEAEIKALLRRHGIETYGTVNDDAKGEAIVWFIFGKTVQARRTAKIVLSLPKSADLAGGQRLPKRTQEESDRRRHEQACREKWRLLVLLIKAKLEAIAAGVSTMEREFLADTVLPNGTPLSEALKPVLAQIYLTGETPPLLGMGEQS